MSRTVKAIVNDIMAIRSQLEGVTFVGGEPFEQARPLAEIGAACRENGLSVVTFSGYTYKELVSGQRDDWNALLGVTDLLLDGPYVNAEKDTSRPWVGSRNQRFIFLTERYSHLKERLKGIPNRLEFIVGSDGSVSLNGLATADEIREAQTALASFGLNMRKA
jgi:anaerobic ribonucleoside-triphosphate reductase activating protein